MRGDETQRAIAPDAQSRERKGPRHAAPRKSLLTKLQIPVGKTMALAAMPTAVFVGMGMAPKLALADDKDIPFAPGPCVTRSDEPPQESPSPKATDMPSKPKDESPSPKASPSASPSASPGATKEPEPETSPSADPSSTAGPQKDEGPADTRTATPDPLDPLGVGDKLNDLLGDLTKKPGEEKPGEEKPGEEKPDEKTPATDGKPAADTGPSKVDSKTAEAIREAAKRSGAKVEDLSDDVKKTAEEPKDETGTKASDDDYGKDKDGKQPFPCPTHDAKALAAAEMEDGVPLLPDEPWYLDSSLLTLSGLDYHGIVEVKTAGGKIKKVLKFTASSVDIKDLYQRVGKSGTVAHLKARGGSTSTIRGGTVTMYTEELKGNLFGLIPITFSPDTPPPLNVPFAFFTNAKVTQAGQFGGTLTVPGLHSWME
ncbi:hypothetical protein [Streptomyces sp. NRRL S-87]|uniref:hypothetical protein n=1 Tax=Streptomyces sp. NRRL S-87 TaxID=1463920 RepID=UPI0004C28203|nr:hypothetical protein [Streptomyces sp. NRRL S-87]